MNHKKIILVGFISAFVAVLTSILGVAGTIIGSVISSMLYNMLTEALERPVSDATFSTRFEWEIAYIFPLAVIALIQLLLIFALLSEWGILPATFLKAFLSLQKFTDNNLYRLLGLAMLVISAYPLIVKPDIIKKSHGAIIAFVGIIFLARGFVDVGNVVTNFYNLLFVYFDFPIAIIAFLLICYVIIKILISAKNYEKEFRVAKHQMNEDNFKHDDVKKQHHSKKHKDFDYTDKRKNIRVKDHKPMNKSKNSNNHKSINKPQQELEVQFKEHIEEKSKLGINKSSDKIQFESNDLLDDYKK